MFYAVLLPCILVSCKSSLRYSEISDRCCHRPREPIICARFVNKGRRLLASLIDKCKWHRGQFLRAYGPTYDRFACTVYADECEQCHEYRLGHILGNAKKYGVETTNSGCSYATPCHRTVAQLR